MKPKQCSILEMFWKVFYPQMVARLLFYDTFEQQCVFALSSD